MVVEVLYNNCKLKKFVINVGAHIIFSLACNKVVLHDREIWSNKWHSSHCGVLVIVSDVGMKHLEFENP